MKMRNLRDLVVTEIGIGCMGFSHGYGKIPDEKYSIEAIQQAYDYGCHFFDTAEGYGPELKREYRGHNEKILGKAVKNFRDKVVIATKLKIDTDEPQKFGSTYNAIKEHLTASLKNLQTDFVDLYYLHRVNVEVPVEDVADAMGRLIKEGLIKGWGMSMVNVAYMERVQKITPLSAVQNIYSMIDRVYEAEVIPYCAKNNIGFVAYSPIASGFLSGKIQSSAQFEKVDDVRNWVPQLKDENISANKPILDLLEKFAEDKNCTKAQISLAWMLKKFPHVVPIPGSKNKERIIENLSASEVELTMDEFNEIDKQLDKIKIHGSRKDLKFPAEFF